MKEANHSRLYIHLQMKSLFASSCLLAFLLCIHSYPSAGPNACCQSSSLASNHPKIDRLCSTIVNRLSMRQPRHRRFAIPFPDMHRFLSTSHKLHHRHPAPGISVKSGTELGLRKIDFHAYLCSIAKDSEAMNSFLTVFTEEYGQPPAFNLFDSCEQINKR